MPGQTAGAGENQPGLDVPVQVDGDHAACTGQVAAQRKGRIPAAADLEQPRTRHADAGLAQLVGHQAPVVDLDVEFAIEIAQAADASLQPVMERIAARNPAECFLQQSFRAPVHVVSAPCRVKETASGQFNPGWTVAYRAWPPARRAQHTVNPSAHQARPAATPRWWGGGGNRKSRKSAG